MEKTLNKMKASLKLLEFLFNASMLQTMKSIKALSIKVFSQADWKPLSFDLSEKYRDSSGVRLSDQKRACSNAHAMHCLFSTTRMKNGMHLF